MTNRCRLTPGVCDSLNRGCLILVAATIMSIMMSAPIYAVEKIGDTDMTAHDYILDRQQSSNCSMVQMNDDELSSVTAAGFSSFNLTGNVTNAYFNVEAQTFTEIQSLKMGYYNNGWDEDWTGVSLGSSTEALTCKGLYIEASFSDITSSTARTLNSIKVGTPSMTGPISATFNSFSGRIEDGTGVPVIVGGQPIDGHRITTLGTKTVYSNSDEFYMQLNATGSKAGWWFYWKNATVN
jgi:hypothetical protein